MRKVVPGALSRIELRALGTEGGDQNNHFRHIPSESFLANWKAVLNLQTEVGGPHYSVGSWRTADFIAPAPSAGYTGCAHSIQQSNLIKFVDAGGCCQGA